MVIHHGDHFGILQVIAGLVSPGVLDSAQPCLGAHREIAEITVVREIVGGKGARVVADVHIEDAGLVQQIVDELRVGEMCLSLSFMDLKRRIPLLRWSVWRMATGARNINKTGQIGDGREDAAVGYVLENARAGDIDDVLATIDKFGYEKSILINVGDEKGLILDAAVHSANPTLALELGTYCGYGALRIARAAPDAQVYSVELAEANAANARQIWAHAGVADRVTCVVGTIGDDGRTLDRLAGEHEFAPGALDFVFLDHDKNVYLNDLQSIMAREWLHPGSIVVADNCKVPGAPKYRAYMREQQGKRWNTVEHKAHLEYQSLVADLVLESEYLG